MSWVLANSAGRCAVGRSKTLYQMGPILVENARGLAVPRGLSEHHTPMIHGHAGRPDGMHETRALNSISP